MCFCKRQNFTTFEQGLNERLSLAVPIWTVLKSTWDLVCTWTVSSRCQKCGAETLYTFKAGISELWKFQLSKSPFHPAAIISPDFMLLLLWFGQIFCCFCCCSDISHISRTENDAPHNTHNTSAVHNTPIPRIPSDSQTVASHVMLLKTLQPVAYAVLPILVQFQIESIVFSKINVKVKLQKVSFNFGKLLLQWTWWCWWCSRLLWWWPRW